MFDLDINPIPEIKVRFKIFELRYLLRSNLVLLSVVSKPSSKFFNSLCADLIMLIFLKLINIVAFVFLDYKTFLVNG